MATSKELAPIKNSDDQLPAYLQGTKVVNDDNFDQSDIVIPRVKLLQSTSAECEAFNDAKTGVFWHTGLDKLLGEEIKFIVADRRKKYLLQAPIQDGQGILARSDDAKKWDRLGKWSVKIKGQKNPVTWEITDLDVEKSGLTKWGTQIKDDENSPPAATLFYDYLIFLPDHLDLGPAVLSLARSQIKKAKKGLNDKIAMHANNGRPMQSLIFQAGVADEVADGQSFKNFTFRSAGFVQSEELFNQMLEYRGSLANLKIQDEASIDEPDRQTDDGEGSF